MFSLEYFKGMEMLGQPLNEEQKRLVLYLESNGTYHGCTGKFIVAVRGPGMGLQKRSTTIYLILKIILPGILLALRLWSPVFRPSY